MMVDYTAGFMDFEPPPIPILTRTRASGSSTMHIHDPYIYYNFDINSIHINPSVLEVPVPALRREITTCISEEITNQETQNIFEEFENEFDQNFIPRVLTGPAIPPQLPRTQPSLRPLTIYEADDVDEESVHDKNLSTWCERCETKVLYPDPEVDVVRKRWWKGDSWKTVCTFCQSKQTFETLPPISQINHIAFVSESSLSRSITTSIDIVPDS